MKMKLANEKRELIERKFGFRMHTAVRCEAVTRPLIACLYRAFKPSSFLDRVGSSSYGRASGSFVGCVGPSRYYYLSETFRVPLTLWSQCSTPLTRRLAQTLLWPGFIWRLVFAEACYFRRPCRTLWNKWMSLCCVLSFELVTSVFCTPNYLTLDGDFSWAYIGSICTC
jgi:hypothetical protein